MARRLTDAQRRAQRADALDRLEAQAAALLTSDGWRAWLRTRATLPNYSANNTLLLLAQALERGFEPTHIAGFRAWLRLGRCVRKGERGLKVFAPLPARRHDEDEDQDRGDGQRTRRMRFGLASVFDVSQTDPLPDVDPAPLRPPIQPLEGESHAHLLVPLREFADSIGYPVNYAELDGAHGCCDHRERTITLAPGSSANHTVAVLLHELAHALLGPNDMPYSIEEVIVEATAYIATAAAGLDSQPSAVPYIAGWGGDDPVAAVHAAANQIDTLASRLQAVIEKSHDRPVEPSVPPTRWPRLPENRAKGAKSQLAHLNKQRAMHSSDPTPPCRSRHSSRAADGPRVERGPANESLVRIGCGLSRPFSPRARPAGPAAAALGGRTAPDRTGGPK